MRNHQGRECVRVGLVGRPPTGGITSAVLPEHWLVGPAVRANPGRIDLLVVYDATPLTVSRCLSMWRHAPILAVLPTTAVEGDALAVLEAGAEACVRTPHTQVVIAHLKAVERRWAAAMRDSASHAASRSVSYELA